MNKQALWQNQEFLKERFDYNPLTGKLTWKYSEKHPKWWNDRHAGQEPTIDDHGYRKAHFLINGVKLSARVHRICFFMVNGWLPDVLDHEDGDKLNNRISNLRPATKLTNAWNQGIAKNNSVGIKGVSERKDKSNSKVVGYRARITHLGKTINLGTYKTAKLAGEAVVAAEIRLRDEWRRKSA